MSSTSHTATQLAFAGTPGAKKIRRGFVDLIGDVLPLCDFVSLLVAAYLGSALYALLFSAPVGATMWIDRGNVALIGAVLTPFILYDQRFAATVILRRYGKLLQSYGLRFLFIVFVVFSIASSSRVLDNLPGTWVGIWLGVSALLTVSSRVLLAFGIRRLKRNGLLVDSIAIVGAGSSADRLKLHLATAHRDAVEVVGIFDVDAGNHTSGSTNVIAPLQSLIELGEVRTIDWILVTIPETEEDTLLALIQQLKHLNAHIALCPAHLSSALPRNMVDYIGGGLPVTLLADRPIKRWSAVVKAVEDVVLSVVLLALLLPVLCLIAIAIKLDSRGPVLFKQRRHAFNNREFDIYKFRTMRWQPLANDGKLRQTARNDDRITRIGRFLRSTSLDELPQLFNVLRGDMSLVGPRPHATNMRTEDRLGSEITSNYAHRHRVKPGLTGWSQVNGARGATDTTAQLQRRVELDLFYIDNWSFYLDLKILLMTCREVWKRTNAY